MLEELGRARARLAADAKETPILTRVRNRPKFGSARPAIAPYNIALRNTALQGQTVARSFNVAASADRASLMVTQRFDEGRRRLRLALSAGPNRAFTTCNCEHCAVL